MSDQFTPKSECQLARPGWWCARQAGHGGACEAYPHIPGARDRAPLFNLLPCPFCGEDAKWKHHSEGSRPAFTNGIETVWRWQSSIHCTGCRLPHCSGFGEVKWEHGNALAQQYAMKCAADKWNRRAP